MNHFTKIGKIVMMGALALGIVLGSCNIQTVQAAEVSVQQTVQTPTYRVYVNRIANCVTVYTKDANGEYTVPVRSFACSCGREGMETPLGSFRTSDYYPWRLMVDGSFGQYAIRFNRGILFHSVPYYTAKNDDLEKDQFNLLGSDASLGCVRLAASDVKWLYDNCEKGTQVVVYDDAENPGLLGKPVQMQINVEHPFAGWDPTDPNPENPWNTVRPSLYLTQDMGDGVLYVPAGTTVEQLKQYVGLKNVEGLTYAPQDYQLYINGNYDLNTQGAYRVWISGQDVAGTMVQQEMILAVIQYNN